MTVTMLEIDRRDGTGEIYEPPTLTRVCEAHALILGGSSGPADSPVDPPTLLNGWLELGLDD